MSSQKKEPGCTDDYLGNFEEGSLLEFSNSTALLERTSDGDWLEEDDFTFLTVTENPFEEIPAEDVSSSYSETGYWEDWAELDAVEIEQLKKGEADNISYNATTRRVMDQVIIREELLASGGPCLPEHWVEEPTYNFPGKPYSTIHYPGVFNVDGSNYGPGILTTDAAMAAKYGVPVEQWRGTVAFHKAVIETEIEVVKAKKEAKKAKREPILPELPAFVFPILALKQELACLRDQRDNPASLGSKELSYYNQQIEETQERLDNLLFEIGSNQAETIDRSNVKPFNYLPCSWLHQNTPETDQYQWKEQSRREYFKGSALPVSELGAPHVLLVLKQGAFEKFQAARRGTFSETSVVESNGYASLHPKECYEAATYEVYPDDSSPRFPLRPIQRRTIVQESLERVLPNSELFADERVVEVVPEPKAKRVFDKLCAGCSKEYSRSDAFTRHLNSCKKYQDLIGGEVKKNHLCEGCQKGFNRSDAAGVHKRKCEKYLSAVEEAAEHLRNGNLEALVLGSLPNVVIQFFGGND